MADTAVRLKINWILADLCPFFFTCGAWASRYPFPHAWVRGTCPLSPSGKSHWKPWIVALRWVSLETETLGWNIILICHLVTPRGEGINAIPRAKRWCWFGEWGLTRGWQVTVWTDSVLCSTAFGSCCTQGQRHWRQTASVSSNMSGRYAAT